MSDSFFYFQFVRHHKLTIPLRTTTSPYGESIQLINPARQLPERPTIANTSRSWFASVFTSETLSVKELDEIVGGPNRPPPRLTHHGGGHHGGGHHGGGEASGSGAEDGKQFGGAFDELKQKMNERGERLNELDAKFADMNAASGDFLKSIREYNERQAQKKWYEF
ncbi:hypothetical protein BC938DRAFT_478539 [Jimgerdemannia flammicorona]|uniref:Lethal giant larvae (Lgl)-like C-terminal domain-containing protein n=1 Tax=Jimgerdemannia flammicorona TaxID=994334 RepID=A0A433P5A5_9FUNG|nr:hypothetical protein BC938DRAFT_478539 [Jimgerdemannia flammicorona]